ncbi:MAG: hypothetical protein M3082_01390 [Candidatus Dormibacteraeota bacterium]|nr:hypothetical protein [Candidatus Dormibacteraeota bacterium]
MIGVAAFAAWLGAAVIVLSDGRRGLALGLGIITVAFTVLAWVDGQRLGAAALLLGGAIATIQRLRTDRDGWGVMPAGSTPRLVLAIAGGLLALWTATSVMTGAGAPLRFAGLSVIGLMAARVLTAGDTATVLTALAALALSVGVASGMADTGAGQSPYIAAGVIAVGVSLIRPRTLNGA